MRVIMPPIWIVPPRAEAKCSSSSAFLHSGFLFIAGCLAVAGSFSSSTWHRRVLRKAGGNIAGLICREVARGSAWGQSAQMSGTKETPLVSFTPCNKTCPQHQHLCRCQPVTEEQHRAGGCQACFWGSQGSSEDPGQLPAAVGSRTGPLWAPQSTGPCLQLQASRGLHRSSDKARRCVHLPWL